MLNEDLDKTRCLEDEGRQRMIGKWARDKVNIGLAKGLSRGKGGKGKRRKWEREGGGTRKARVAPCDEIRGREPHLAWQLLETVRYLVPQHLFGLRAAWTFQNCP